MRILIYLLAMLSGFSAAEAARPVSSTPASVDAAVAQAYVAVSAFEAVASFEPPVGTAPMSQVSLAPASGKATPAVLDADTPVDRHDIILG
ncbi:hypothetical protein [Sphingorhabdus sp.]|uniref:hypothetical protein n=1 Tax=Sphingorhabdus sp. TaxID=1902408 RepID=UPI00391C92E0